ncbi:putative ABC transport system permease protein [Nitrosomonas marina]|uniref:Putative ABC transport system permease protein n=1 Tax=Nitrosomonas marina TaxID=917 RepID=A0A1I0B0Z5_9PROT|nr:FtsX-like permease family protein [Nitrosomonas marina]SET00380.1 putative ABC transport system permease protein [Nitrosomonas marina]
MNASTLSGWLLLGEWRARFVQVMVAVMAIAIGVALGFSIHLVNTAAFNEFSAASKSLSGQSDLQIYSRQGYFDELLYPRLAQYEGVRLVNPVLEFTARISDKQNGENERKLKILGIDMFRAARISPDLLGVPAEDRRMDGLANDAVFLSPAAMEWLQVGQGDMLRFNVGTQTFALRVAGGVTRVRAGQRIAVMDIGAAQWRFNYLGLLSRIELKLDAGIHHEAFRKELERELGAQFFVTELEEQEARLASMSRAYRVNLNMLALVALFTGAFLVFSTQVLSVMRRRSQLALLRVLGFTRKQLMRQIVTEGVVLGVIGSFLGLALGYGFATLVIQLFGGDLGSIFFSDIQPDLNLDLDAALVYFAVGLGVTLLGTVLPARDAMQIKPAVALKSDNKSNAIERLSSPWPAFTCLVVALLLTQLPPVGELPVFGYLAIALLLIGGIALMPRFAAWFFSFVLHIVKKRFSDGKLNAIVLMVLARLANVPGQASVALSGVLASFSLMVAMAIMVLSFRVSVDNWLEQVLPADLYVRSADSGRQGGFLADEQESLAGLPLFSRIDFLRYQQLVLDPERPEVTLIARAVDLADPRNTLPIVGEFIKSSQLSEHDRPIWVSEAMVDLYGYTVGKQVRLPVGNGIHTFVVAGVWRDYGRQFGAVQMQLSDYQELTDDMSVNTAAMWLRSQATMDAAYEALQQLPYADTLEITQSQAIRTTSLQIFDRSFAVTYLLEIIAVIIGLLGVATSFSVQMLARSKEFGMLRHIGVTRKQILALLAAEGSLLTMLGVVLGFILGGIISLILIFIINPQSFHWTMQLSMPWNWLLLIAAIMLVAATVTALIAGRRAVSGSVVRAVREDW